MIDAKIIFFCIQMYLSLTPNASISFQTHLYLFLPLSISLLFGILFFIKTSWNIDQNQTDLMCLFVFFFISLWI